jgi:hypothetical protein
MGPPEGVNRLNFSTIINQRHKGPLCSDSVEDEVGWGQGQVGRISGSVEPDQAPPPYLFHVAPPKLFPMSVPGGFS